MGGNVSECENNAVKWRRSVIKYIWIGWLEVDVVF